MGLVKTTLYLPDELRRRLKEAASRRNTTMTELLAEGAKLVVARDRRGVDRDELLRRAAAARAELRRGLYHGPSIADAADQLAYASSRRAAATR